MLKSVDCGDVEVSADVIAEVNTRVIADVTCDTHLRNMVACSYAKATRSSRPSSQGRARNCRPVDIGERPELCANPIGTVIAGAPVGGATCGESLPARR